MRPERHAEEHVNHERWLLSYSDFITLLFAFFVVLFATTYHDNQAIRKLSHAIQEGFQTLGVFSRNEVGDARQDATSISDLDTERSLVDHKVRSPLSVSSGSALNMLKLKKQLESVMGKELAQHEMVLESTPEGFIISLKELGFFNSGQAQLLPGAEEKIVRIARVLSRADIEIRVEGHSDNQPIHTAQFQSNWELSAARAMSVLRLFVSQGGFDPTRISASGFGQYRPIGDNSTPAGRRMNRRVDLVVVQTRTTIVTAH